MPARIYCYLALSSFSLTIEVRKFMKIGITGSRNAIVQVSE